MTNNPFFLLILLAIGIGLMVFAYSLFSLAQKKPSGKPDRQHGNPGEAGVCPVCSVRLRTGEQLKSALFPGEKDRLCHIFGCPSCLPFPQEGVTRRCPVCKKKVDAEGYLVARLFQRPGNKRHVHILGCTGCRLTAKPERP